MHGLPDPLARMTLSRLDQKVLKLIWTVYRVAFDPKQTNIAVGEMPLPSKADILHHFKMKGVNSEDVETSLARLEGFRIIAAKTLLHPESFKDQLHGTGKLRLVNMPRFVGDRPPTESFATLDAGVG